MTLKLQATDRTELNRQLRRSMIGLHLQIVHAPGSPFGQTRLYRELEQFEHTYARLTGLVSRKAHSGEAELLQELRVLKDALPTPDPDRRDQILNELRDLLERIEENLVLRNQPAKDVSMAQSVG